MRYVLLVLALTLLAVHAFSQSQKSLPTLNCIRIDRDIVLTGKLDDPLWKSAKPVNLNDAYTGARPRFATTARLLYNQQYLYIGFTCEDDYIWSTYTRRDDPLYMEDVVEVFLSPTGSLRHYYEIEVSPRNTVADSVVLNGRLQSNTSWDNFHNLFNYNMQGLLTKTYVEGELNRPGAGKRWSVEIAVPFAALIGPEPTMPRLGTQWRINLYRCDTPPREQMEFYAWSTIKDKSDLHRPWYFGHLKFVGKK